MQNLSRENEFIRVTIENHFHNSGFALGLAMKQRFGVTWRWSIKTDCFQLKLKKQTNKRKQSKISLSLYSSLRGDNLDQYNLLLPYLSGNTNFSQRTKCWVRGVNMWVPLSRYLTLIILPSCQENISLLLVFFSSQKCNRLSEV